jgi:hypothetical protein
VCWHTLALHFGDEFTGASSHTVGQLPQWFTSLVVLISQPSRLVFSVLQLAKPGLHAMLHAPAVQLGVPFTVLHEALQPPQLVVLVLTLVSHPLPAFPSQLPKPAVQLPSWQLAALQKPVPFV